MSIILLLLLLLLLRRRPFSFFLWLLLESKIRCCKSIYDDDDEDDDDGKDEVDEGIAILLLVQSSIRFSSLPSPFFVAASPPTKFSGWNDCCGNCNCNCGCGSIEVLILKIVGLFREENEDDERR